MKIKAASEEAYQLFHEGALALAQIEANGMRMDEAYLESALEETKNRIETLERELMEDDVWKTWKGKYGSKANLGSVQQMSDVIFGELGHDYPWDDEDRTKGGLRRADRETFERVPIPFCRKYRDINKIKKVRSTYLIPFKRETVNGYMHPNFWLNKVVTYRSSSSNPNFQNNPVRDLVQAEWVRRCIIANGQVGESDFKQVEVKVGACYHKDKKMLEYCRDPLNDMHHDAAKDLFILKDDQVSKELRACAKGRFVFAEFYGEWYIKAGRKIWDAMEMEDLKLKDGTSVRKHLKRKGITKLGKCDPDQRARPGTYENHIREVERILWDERHPGYRDWKKKFFALYEKRGWFEMYTGFVVSGLYDKNDVVNYPIQGAAFHCALWVLIQLQKWLVKNKMKTKIIGQIHDSIVADVHRRERDDYFAKVNKLISRDLPRHWPWIIVPMSCENAIAPRGGSWFDKKEIKNEAVA